MNHRTITALSALALAGLASASLLTDPNDPRNWQGATVGTFADLIYGADNATTRQQVIDSELLDDSIFDPTGFSPAVLTPTSYLVNTGYSFDTTGTGLYDYTTPSPMGAAAGNAIDEHWVQTGWAVGQTVWDLGALSSFAAIFPTIDHGPLPQEAIEATVYLSNDQVVWEQAHFVRVWLEGYRSNLGIKWDGFTYVVTTNSGGLFRYASVIHGGPGALFSDGDDEINGILGMRAVPEPSALIAFFAAAAAAMIRRRRR